MIFLLFVAGILVASVSADVPLTDCPPNTSNAPAKNNLKITKFFIPDCTKQPCEFRKGKTYRIELGAIFNFTTTKLPYTGVAVVSGLPVTLMSGNLCDNIKAGNCTDIKPGVELTGYVDQTAPNIAPIFKGTLRIIINDDKNTPQFCGELTVSVVGPHGETENIGLGLGG